MSLHKMGAFTPHFHCEEEILTEKRTVGGMVHRREMHKPYPSVRGGGGYLAQTGPELK